MSDEPLNYDRLVALLAELPAIQRRVGSGPTALGVKEDVERLCDTVEALAGEVDRLQTDVAYYKDRAARPHHATVAGSLAGHPLEAEHLAAVAAARGEGGGWVAVTERLPRADTRVLVIENDRHGGVYYVASWLGLDDDPEWLDEGTEWMEDGSHERLHPTHWMPLPEPPEEPAP